MDVNASDTKMLLITAAGELFAEHGYDGVSTRMIADRAGVNLGGIHYHFGSKEALYVEAFKFACRQEEHATPSQVLEEHPERADTPEGLAEAIALSCRRMLGDVFHPDKPEWQVRLIARELANPSAAMPILVKDIFREDVLGSMEFYRRIRPEATDDEAMVWTNLVRAQAVFHLLARDPIQLVRDGKPLDEPFFDELVRATSLALIALAGLPVPESLKTPASAQQRSRR